MRELPLTPDECLETLLARIQSGKNLEEVAFTEGHITYHHLRCIDQGTNPHLYTELSLNKDNNYEPPCFQDDSSQGEEEEEVEEEEE